MKKLYSLGLILRFCIGVFVVSLLVGMESRADVIIAPGETSPPLQAEDCSYSSGGPLGDCLGGCFTGCDAGNNTAEATLDVSNYTAGKKFVATTVYTDFIVKADSSNAGNEVDGTISYDIEWAGGWTLYGVFTGFNDVKSTMTISLYDLSATGRVVRSATLHSMTTDGFIGIDIIDVGFGLDNGSTVNSMSANLIRGHTYRLGLTIRCEGKSASNANVILDYQTSGWGLWWNDLKVSVGIDLEEEIEKLWKALETHTHIYLTGRGEGHNNTEAQTSPAIIMDDSVLADKELDWLPDDELKSKSLPLKSKMSANYPNPFNAVTTISYTLPELALVKIKIYNVLGQLVTTLVNEEKQAGTYSVQFDATQLASGIYYYRLTAENYAETRKLTLIK